MSRTSRPITIHDVHVFLVNNISAQVTKVAPLGAGQWSSAYCYDVGNQRFVLRLGDFDEDYEKDRIAAAFGQPGLPVPEFVAAGEAFERFFAITERASGKFLDALTPLEMRKSLPSLFRVLDAMRRIPVATGSGYGGWDRNGRAPYASWPEYLLAIENENPRIAGWKARLRTWPEAQAAFDEGLTHLNQLVGQVRDDRHVIHCDLVNRNVLVDEQVGLVTSVFDWGCSLYGDFLYDVAWLAYCAPYTKGIVANDLRRLAHAFFATVGANVDNFDGRLRCYEVHIGLDSLAYHAFLDRREEAVKVAEMMLASATRPTTELPSISY